MKEQQRCVRGWTFRTVWEDLSLEVTAGATEHSLQFTINSKTESETDLDIS